MSDIKEFTTFGNYIEKLKDTVRDGYDNVKNVWAERTALKQNINQAKTDANADTYTDFKQIYCNEVTKNQKNIYQESKNYWNRCSIELKNELIKIVADSNAIDEKQKDIVKDTIAKFQQISLEQIIIDVKIEPFIKWFSKRFNVAKWVSTHNMEMKKSIEKLYMDTQKRHKGDFEDWATKLYNVILENIDSMNPTLKRYQNRINQSTERKEQLKKHRSHLEYDKNYIENLMSWQLKHEEE